MSLWWFYPEGFVSSAVWRLDAASTHVNASGKVLLGPEADLSKVACCRRLCCCFAVDNVCDLWKRATCSGGDNKKMYQNGEKPSVFRNAAVSSVWHFAVQFV